MFAKVESALSIRSPLLYNEQKVELKQAIFLDARNFWQEKDDLSLRDKQQRFDNLTDLNDRSEKKILHVSVNFHPDDNLTDKEMTKLATKFMTAIDFKDQPWLVYRHIDAGHPHMHIVSTNIRRDGSRILNDLRAPKNLIKICSRIEREHKLTPALAPPKIYYSDPRHKGVPSLTYGEIPTRSGIEMVIGYVKENYIFTSFESYNAILSLYNVRADRGNPEGRMYESRGLYYRMIDVEGKKLGAPVKASDFHMGVTLDAIEERCRQNLAQLKTSAIESMRVGVDFNIIGVQNLGKLREQMARRGQRMIIPAFTRREVRGKTQPDKPGLFYVDFNTMTVLRDTQLGPDYTADAILRRLSLDKHIPEVAAKLQLELKPAEKALLDNPDLAHPATRDLFLRLSVQHDKWIEAQQEQQRLTHRHGLHL